jgi:hypothetical protein
MKSCALPRMALLPAGLLMIAIGVLLLWHSGPLFGMDHDLVAGLVTGAGVGLLAVLVVYSTVRVRDDR